MPWYGFLKVKEGLNMIDIEQFIENKVKEGKSVIQIMGLLREQEVILPFVTVQTIYNKLRERK